MKRKKRVVEWAELYKKQYYLVHVNLEGWGKPTTIKGNIPDIMASKVLDRLVVQVETHDSIDTEEAKNKREAFEDWAKQLPNRKFMLDIV